MRSILDSDGFGESVEQGLPRPFKSGLVVLGHLLHFQNENVGNLSPECFAFLVSAFNCVGAAIHISATERFVFRRLEVGRSAFLWRLIVVMDDATANRFCRLLVQPSVVVNGEPGDPSMVDERGLCSY